MAINSRAKGNRNERKVAELLSAWTGRKFARTPSSGGLSWKNTNAKGDIVCTTEGHYFPFCVEVKAHRDINFEHLLYLEKPKILEFWKQCSRDSELIGKIPLLFMRYDRMPRSLFFVAIPTKVFEFLNLKPSKGDAIKLLNSEITILRSDDFLQASYKESKLIIKKKWPRKKP